MRLGNIDTPENYISPAVAEKASVSLKKQVDFITREWLKSLIDVMDLDALKRFPTQEMIVAVPRMIDKVADGMAHPIDEHISELRELALHMASLRTDRSTVAEIIDDNAALKRLMLQAAAQGLRKSDLESLLTYQRLDLVVAEMLKEELGSFTEVHSRHLREQANTDPLTGLYNVRYFKEQLASNIEMNRRYQVPFVVMMLDVDDLKLLNDTEGHPAGDRALRHIAEILVSEKRATDIAVRYGGDEFFLILPGIRSSREADSLAHRIVDHARDINRETGGREMTSVSIGLASCSRNGTGMDSLLQRADNALYAAKASGRGSVAHYDKMMEEK
ncbi:MAG: GGDEF domain-containing protein [Thermoleophilia bacterium]